MSARRAHLPLAILALLAPLAAVATIPARAALPEGSPARLPEGATATEIWTLVGRFDSGHDVVAEIAVTNLGPGERTAAVIGHVMDPQGRVHRFRKAKRAGHWELSPDGLALDIGPILLDQREGHGIFEVDRDVLKLHVRFELDATRAAPAELTGPGRGFELAQISGRARGRFWRSAMEEPVALEGHVGLTHRWAREEGSGIAWWAELVDVRNGVGLFLAGAREAQRGRETQASRRGWLVQRLPGGTLRTTRDFEAEVVWRGDEGEAARTPARIVISGPEVQGRFEVVQRVLRYDPFGELPGPVRWLLALQLRIRSAWDTATFELTWKDGERHEVARIDGSALVGLTHLERGALARSEPQVRSPSVAQGGMP